jgi:hypothetical protein
MSEYRTQNPKRATVASKISSFIRLLVLVLFTHRGRENEREILVTFSQKTMPRKRKLSAKALEAETIKQKKQKSEYSFQDPKTTILSDSAKAQLNDSIQEKLAFFTKRIVDWLRPSTVPAGITDIYVMNSDLSKTMVPSGLRSVLSALKHQALELFNIDLNAGSFCITVKLINCWLRLKRLLSMFLVMRNLSPKNNCQPRCRLGP